MKGLAVTFFMRFCEKRLLEVKNRRNNQNPTVTEMVGDSNSNLLFHCWEACIYILVVPLTLWTFL